MNVNAFSQKDYENETAFMLKKTNPIKANLRRNDVNFCATGYYESKPTFAVRKARPNNPNVDITTAWSSAARITTPGG